MQVSRVKVYDNKHSMDMVVSEMQKGNLVYGDNLVSLEEKLKGFFNRKYCVLTSNCFFSIFLSIKAMGLRNKKILIPSVATCFSFFNAIKATGNTPVLCDVDLQSGNLDLNSVAKVYKEQGFDAILSVNHMGKVMPTEELLVYNVPVIEDCAQSFLSSTMHKSKSTVQVFSFYPTKIANGIDGGAILTDDEALFNSISEIVNYNDQYKDDGIVRYNCKLSNINATFLLGNLSMIDSYKERHREQIVRYGELEGAVNVLINEQNVFNYKLLLGFDSEEERDEFVTVFSELGVSKEFVSLSDVQVFPKGKKLITTTCSIPLYYELKNEEIKYIVQKIKEYYENI